MALTEAGVMVWTKASHFAQAGSDSPGPALALSDLASPGVRGAVAT